MSDVNPESGGGSEIDRIVRFSLPHRNARGRIIRLGPVLETVLSAHDYPAPIKHLLAEALVLTAMLGSLLKDEEGQITLQAQAENGIVSLFVCDWRAGEIRGYVEHDAEKVGNLGPNPTLEALFGTGYLAVTFDLAVTNQRYQGVVPLEGASLSEAVERYFAQSEQIPTLIRVGVTASASSCLAGGMLIQHLPDGEEGRERLHVQMDHPDWEHVQAIAGSIRHGELVDTALSAEDILWRLFHEEAEVRVDPGSHITRGCRCTEEYYRQVLSRFGEEARAEMRDESGMVQIDCAFCSKLFRIAI